MSASNAWENAYLQLVFQNVSAAGIGDAIGLQASSTAGSLYLSLHTGDPGESGTQATNEANYTGYSRAAVARSAAGWDVSSGVASNAAQVQWPVCTAGSSTVTYFGVGTAATGAGGLLWSGSCASLAVSSGILPTAAVGAITVTVD